METAVNKLEAMFQRAEADLEYMEKQLKYEFMTNIPENETAENPVKLLEDLTAIKARHKALCTQMEEIAAEQKQSVDSIRAHLNSTMQLVQELQQTSDCQVPPLTAKEQEASAILGVPVTQQTDERPSTSEAPDNEQSQSSSERKFEELSEAELEAVPRSVRSNIKLADLNAFYKQLFEHFISKKNSGTLSLAQMKKMNMKANDAKLKTLKHLSVIELDKKGQVQLVVRY